MTEQWGAPLTGAQMKLLRAAGLPDDLAFFDGGFRAVKVGDVMVFGSWPNHLPASNIAYTLLNAGWLDGRNVRLWFGGDKAPDDWDWDSVLLADGFACDRPSEWSSSAGKRRIIAYIAKDEVDVTKTPVDDHQSNLMLVDGAQTVTIAKMTEAEARTFATRIGGRDDRMYVFEVLSELGLIREPTREERFWAMHEPEGTTIPTHIKKWVKDALEFER